MLTIMNENLSEGYEEPPPPKMEVGLLTDCIYRTVVNMAGFRITATSYPR